MYIGIDLGTSEVKVLLLAPDLQIAVLALAVLELACLAAMRPPA